MKNQSFPVSCCSCQFRSSEKCSKAHWFNWLDKRWWHTRSLAIVFLWLPMLLISEHHRIPLWNAPRLLETWPLRENPWLQRPKRKRSWRRRTERSKDVVHSEVQRSVDKDANFSSFLSKILAFHDSWRHDRTSERVKPQFHLGFKAVEEKSVAWMLWCAAGFWMMMMMMMMISLKHKNRSTLIFFDASFSYENPRCSHWKPKVKSSWRLEVMNKNIHPNPLKPRRCWTWATWGLEGLDGYFVREKRKGNDGRKWRKRCLFLVIFGLVFRLILPRKPGSPVDQTKDGLWDDP